MVIARMSIATNTGWVVSVVRDTGESLTCILCCENLDKKQEMANHRLGSIVCHHRFSDGSVLTTGYSLQFSGELLKCNCLLLLLSNSCHFYVALPFSALL